MPCKERPCQSKSEQRRNHGWRKKSALLACCVKRHDERTVPQAEAHTPSLRAKGIKRHAPARTHGPASYTMRLERLLLDHCHISELAEEPTYGSNMGPDDL